MCVVFNFTGGKGARDVGGEWERKSCIPLHIEEERRTSSSFLGCPLPGLTYGDIPPVYIDILRAADIASFLSHIPLLTFFGR